MMPKTIAGPGLMIGGDRNNPLDEADYTNPKVKHITLRDRWAMVNPAKGKFDFTYILRLAEKCVKNKKPYIIGIMSGAGGKTGPCQPTWLPGAKIKTDEGFSFVAPWEPSIARYWEDLLSALLATFHADEYFSRIWINGPSVPSQEMHIKPIMNVKGYTPEKMEQAWIKAIDLTAIYFRDVELVLSLSGQNPSQKFQPDVIEYAKKSVAKKRLCFQFNSLGKQTSPSYLPVRLLQQFKTEGYRVGAEMVGPGHGEVLKKYSWLDFTVGYDNDERYFK